MANPQAENGHVDIANEIVEALARYRLSGEEMQCLWVIFRKTYGWKKLEDKISLSQFSEMTGLIKQDAHRALKKLSSKKVIDIIKNGYRQINSYKFIKDFDKWIPLPKKGLSSPLLVKGVTKNGKALSPKMVNTKETTTKDTITKEKYSLVPHQKIIDFYHEILPELPRVIEWTEFRKRTLQTRWREKKERQSLEWWESFFLKIKNSDFLCGRVKDFKADLEWCIKPKNFIKILEGRYNGTSREISHGSYRESKGKSTKFAGLETVVRIDGIHGQKDQ